MNKHISEHKYLFKQESTHPHIIYMYTVVDWTVGLSAIGIWVIIKQLNWPFWIYIYIILKTYIYMYMENYFKYKYFVFQIVKCKYFEIYLNTFKYKSIFDPMSVCGTVVDDYRKIVWQANIWVRDDDLFFT